MSDRSEGGKSMNELLHDLTQPLNVISLSCVNMQNRIEIEEMKDVGVYLSGKVEKIRQSIEDASKILEQIKVLCA